MPRRLPSIAGRRGRAGVPAVGLATLLGLSLLACLLALVTGSLATLRATSYTCVWSAHMVTDIFFLDSDHGWITVLDQPRDRLSLFGTRDGGRSWQPRGAPPGLYRVWFLNRQSGWGVTYQPASGISGSEAGSTMAPGTNRLLRTLDGGETWTVASVSPLTRERWASISGLAFADSSQGWACGSTGDQGPIVLRTSDGGRTFQPSTGLPRDIGPCYGVYFRRSVGLWIYGGGFVLHSSGGGKSWEQPPDVTRLGIDSVYSAFFFDDGRGWLVGHGPGWSVLSTTDFGQHWRPTPGMAGAESIWFSDGARGRAVVNPTSLLCTSDGGLTWNGGSVLPPAKDGLFDPFASVVMPGSGRGFALRACGSLYETTDDGQTWREFDPLKQAKGP